jgi:hypothetical protein
MRSIKAEVVELDHTYRINGVFDIFKLGFMIYDFEIKKLKQFNNHIELLEYAEFCISKYKSRSIYESRNMTRFLDSYDVQKMKSKINTVAEDYAILNAVKGEDDMYIVFVDGRVKIGRSKDYKKRFDSMSTAFPSDYFGYVFLDLGNLEKRMHKIFEEYNTKGEWFQDNDRIRRFCQFPYNGVRKIIYNPKNLKIAKYSRGIYLPNKLTTK